MDEERKDYPDPKNTLNRNRCQLQTHNVPTDYVENTKFIENPWRVELIAGEKSLTEVKIQRWIFWGDVLTLLLFAIARMPLNRMIKKSTEGYKLPKSKEENQIPNVRGRHQSLCQK